MKAVHTSVRSSDSEGILGKKECLRKTRCPNSEVRWDVDRFNVSVIIHVIFVTRCEIKSLSPQKKTNCPVRGCAGGARSLALARMRRHAVMLYNFTKAQKLQACSSTVK